MELILFIGLQASGKTTFYKNRFFDTHIRLNLDMLRTRHRENILFKACLESKSNIVIDNTNPLVVNRASYISEAKPHKYKITGYYFSADISLSLQRNKTRAKPVPDIAIANTFKKLQLPSYDEGFDELYYVKTENGDISIEIWKT